MSKTGKESNVEGERPSDVRAEVWAALKTLAASVENLVGHQQNRDRDLQTKIVSTVIAWLNANSYTDVFEVSLNISGHNNKVVYGLNGDPAAEFDGVIFANNPNGEIVCCLVEAKQSVTTDKIDIFCQKLQTIINLGNSTVDTSNLPKRTKVNIEHWRNLFHSIHSFELFIGGPNMDEDLRNYAARKSCRSISPNGLDYNVVA